MRQAETRSVTDKQTDGWTDDRQRQMDRQDDEEAIPM